MARLREHRGVCDQCGFSVTIPAGHQDSPCPTCGGKGIAHRTREARPPYGNDGAPKRSLFDCPVNPLPFLWINWISIRNFYRYAARRSLDTFSLVLAILTIGIPVRLDAWRGAHGWMEGSRSTVALFIGGSVVWILGVFLKLWESGTRGQWGQVLPEECTPRQRSIRILVSLLPFPWKRSTGRWVRRPSYAGRLVRYLGRLGRIEIAPSHARSPGARRAPYWISVVVIGAAAGMLHSGQAGLLLITLLGTADVVVLLVVIFYGMYRMAYDRVPPEEYASLVLGGRRAETMFRWIAWKMYDLCSTFLDANPRLKAAHGELAVELRALQNDPRPNSEILTRMRKRWTPDRLAGLRTEIEALEKTLLGQRMSIRRCAAMKTLAASELGIHHRRLCDNVFRFSPTIFERRVSQYVRNWRTIARAIEVQHGHVPVGRLVDLIQENERIAKRIRRRSNYLRLIVGSKGFFEDVRVFASTASVGESLAAYASAITRVAEESASGRSGRLQKAQLASVYLMQQAHPGMDLHRALTQLCRGGVPWCGERIKELKTRAEFLDGRAEKEGDPKWRDAADSTRRKCADLQRHAEMWRQCTHVLEIIGRDAGHSSTPIASLGILRDLETLVSAATHNTQWEINRAVEQELLRWLRDRSNVLIMTYGNSRVVRDVIKCVAMPLLERKSNEKHADMIFIARTGADEFESRMMAFSLREDRRWYAPGTTAELGYGDDALLMSLIRDLKDRDLSVMILLGAESFDSDGRIVQLASAHEQIAQLKEHLSPLNKEDSKRVWFVAVAESYKESADLTQETGLFRDHLDQVALYPRGIIDLIISNNKRYDIASAS
jgi:predicted RNA-binding Zn-ribbon protein involved in translation (DUF1610 family)